MSQLTKLNRRLLIATTVTLALAATIVGCVRTLRNVQVFDLSLKGVILTPEWSDDQYVSILRTDYLSTPIAGAGSNWSNIAVTPTKTLKVRERDSASEVAWLSNADGSNQHVVTRLQESGSLFNKYIQNYDEHTGPTGDEMAWSCDSKYFAFIRGNPGGKRQLYFCRAQ